MIERYDAPGQSLPLFEAAGVEVEKRPAPAKTKRQRRTRPPTPAERAAAARLKGARRPACPCTDTGRRRIGGPRDLSLPKVFGFPLSRNAAILQEMINRLPHGYDDSLDDCWTKEARKLRKKLQAKGLSEQSASDCANELVRAAWHYRVDEAHKEAGIL